jgi:hypothetical protein
MPRKRAKLKQKRDEIVEDWKLKLLADGFYDKSKGFEFFEFYYDNGTPWGVDGITALWPKIKKEFMRDWIDKHPCSRPYAWWRWDAPRQDDKDVDCFWHGTLPEPRLKVSAGGEICKYFVPLYHFGVFKYWHYREDDLPLFESEAAYLKRLDLLTISEKKYLDKHPELLEPVNIRQAIPGHEPEVITDRSKWTV